LRLTWGYYFPEAAASHQEAARHDPDHPMPYWGLALAISPNPNTRYGGGPDDPEDEGFAAISKARELRTNGNSVEQDLIDALFVRYDAMTYPDRQERDQAYFEASRALYEKYPQDPDVVSLYADSLMIMSPWSYWGSDGQPEGGFEEVIEALDRSAELHPEHPGVNHLYIHIVEASPNPERALPHAKRLETLMPTAGHVVHMPSHIYVRTGNYVRAIEMNEFSLQADERFLAQWGDLAFPTFTTHPLSSQAHAWHATEFIRYIATVQGSYERASEAARETVELLSPAQLESGTGQRAIAAVWFVHKAFGQWDALLNEPPPTDEFPYLVGMRLYLEGSAYANRGDLDMAEEMLLRLRESARDPDLDELLVRVNPASKVLKIAAHGLEGEIKQAKNDLDGAVAAFSEAVEIEDQLSYMEPPDWPQPMRHYLGAALLEAGQAANAEQVYRQDLSWNQKNGWSLLGLLQSLQAQGKAEEVRDAAASFGEAWQGADVELARSRF
jgi:tetratricopeptide (TPR) repeat protein